MTNEEKVTEPIPWEAALEIQDWLDGKEKLYWAISIWTGYRVGDILPLKWKSLKDRSYLNILEMKGMGKLRHKARNIIITEPLKEIIDAEYQKDYEYFYNIMKNRQTRKMSEIDFEYKVHKFVKNHLALWHMWGSIKPWTQKRCRNIIERSYFYHDLVMQGENNAPEPVKKLLSNRSSGCHALRKTFGIRFWEVNGKNERALFLLKDIFMHKSIRDTRVYLGILQEYYDEAVGKMV